MNTDKLNVNDLKIPLVVGITGHRDIKENKTDLLKEKISEIFQSLKSKYPNTPIIFLTPLADGADRLGAEIAFDENIHVSIPLPMDIKTYKTTFGKGILKKGTSKEDEDKFINKSILEFDNLLEIVNKQSNKYIPNEIPMLFDKEDYDNLNPDEQRIVRRKQYSIVGEYIAIHSHILIGLYDEKAEEKPGGTKEIVRKKLTGEYEYFNLSKEEVTYPEVGIVYSISTPNNMSDVNNENIKIKKHFPNNYMEEWDYKKEKKSVEKIFKNKNSFTKQHKNIDNFNKDVEIHKEKIKEKLKKDLEFDPKKNIKENNLIHKNIILRRSAACLSDDVYQKLLVKKEIFIQMLISITVFVIAFKSSFSGFTYHKYLDLIYITFAIFSYFAILNFKKSKEKQENYRAIAEGLRVQTAWNIVQINQSVALYYLSHQKEVLGWIRSAIRGINIFYIPKKENINIDEKKVCEYWIDHQINYFKNNAIPKQIKEKESLSKKLNISLLIFFISTLIYVYLNTFTSLIKDSTLVIYSLTQFDFIQILFILFPLTYASHLKAKQLFKGNDQLIKEYTLSLDIFKRAKKLLEFNNLNKQKVCKKLGIEALRENGSWIITRREKEYNTPS